jgi:low affinity Fe/Cu permease
VADEKMPRDVTPHVGFFDRFAQTVDANVSRAWFFSACVLLVVVWAPSYFVFGNVDTWQLVINTATTIVTFLLVALLQNTATRKDKATQHKLNAVALALSSLVDGDVRAELRAAVGVEDKESS